MAMLLRLLSLGLVAALGIHAAEISLEERLELQKKYVRLVADRLAAHQATQQATASQRAVSEAVEKLRAACTAEGKDLAQAEDGDVACIVAKAKESK